MTLAALLYLVFVIYGSLAPLAYDPVHADGRLALLFDPLQFDWSRQSRTDVSTNVLLAMPLAFLWCAVATSGGRRWPFGGPILVLLGTALVGLGVEFAQVYFPPRTPSLVDCIAQIAGAGLSALCWAIWGRRFLGWLAGIRFLTTVPMLATRLLLLYGAGLLASGLFPLNLSLSMAELYRKWRDGRVLIVPFVEWGRMDALMLYGFITDVVLWVPVGILGILAFPRSGWVIVAAGGGAAAVLEFLQLFVLSRTTDATQVVAACIGSGAGVLLAMRHASRPTPDPSTQQMRRLQPKRMDVRLLLAAMGWFILLCAVFWYPYDFQAVPNANVARELLSGAPFEQLFSQGELRGFTELLRKTLFFIPLGALICLSLAGPRKRWPPFLGFTVSAIALLAAATVIENGKFFLPGKFPGGTNIFLEFAGGLIGYWAVTAWEVWQSGTAHAPTDAHALPTPQPSRAGGRALPLLAEVGIVLAAGTMLWLLTKHPQIPYNLRNLPHPAYPYVSMVLVAGLVIWSVGFPAWIGRRLVLDRHAVRDYPLWLGLYGFVAWCLIFAAVVPLRAQKVVGTPILDWPWHFEWLMRFLVLMAGIGAFAVLGFILGDGQDRRRRLAIWFLHGAWLLPLVYWIVVTKAATDNIAELLDGDASPTATLLFGLVITTMAAAAAQLRLTISAVSARKRIWALVAVMASFPLGYGLLHAATDPVIVKYGKVFSGMQFMLSADREHYARGGMLIVRYCVFHLLFVLAATAGDWMFRERRPATDLARRKSIAAV